MVNLVLVYLEMMLVSVQDRCMGCGKRTIGLETFWKKTMELLGDVAHVESRSVHSMTVLVLVQDRNHFGCTRWYS
jgi:hypothetical protein